MQGFTQTDALFPLSSVVLIL